VRPTGPRYVHAGCDIRAVRLIGVGFGHGRYVNHISAIPDIRKDLGVLLIGDAGNITNRKIAQAESQSLFGYFLRQLSISYLWVCLTACIAVSKSTA
jgi:hypothetical protein